MIRNVISGAITSQLLPLTRLLLFFLAMVTKCRVQEILFFTAAMARGFSASVIFIHSIRLCTMSFFFQLANLDGVRIFLMLSMKMKLSYMRMIMEIGWMASALLYLKQNTSAISFSLGS